MPNAIRVKAGVGLFGGLPRSPMKDVIRKKMVVGAPRTQVSERNFVPQKLLTPASTLRNANRITVTGIIYSL